MPRYTKETAEAKAALLIKPYIRNGLDQSKTARELGVTSEAINQRLKRKPVQDYLRKFIDSPQLKRRLVTVAQEALRATRITKKGNKPDHDVRHKYWHDLVTAGGVLKNDGAAGGVKIVNIIHNYREKKDAGST